MKSLAEKPLDDFDHKTVGARVAGEVVELDEAESEYGRFPVLVVDDGERLVRVPCMRSNLRSKLGDIRVGDAVSIRYLGEKPMANGKRFNAYRVHVEQAERAIDRLRVPSVRDEPVDDYDDNEPF